MKHSWEQDVPWNDLDRYFSGEASPEASARVEDCIAQPGGAAWVESVREVWDAAGATATLSPPDVDSAWRSLSLRANLSDTEDSGSQPARDVLPFGRAGTAWRRGDSALERGRHKAARPELRSPAMSHRRRRPPAWAAAIAASLLIVAGALATGQLGELVQRAKHIVSGPPELREFATRRAQRANLYLPDGSHVVLNVDSRLLVPEDFGRRSREVALVGEAYFDVALDRAKPFRVTTAAGIARVAGTEFFVSHYPEADGMRVGVASGTVIVGQDSASDSEALTAGDVARVDRSGGITVRRGANVDDEMAWITGTLVFNRVPLREAVPRLARWFDIDIRVADSVLNEIRYSGSFSNEPAEQALELFAASLDARIEGDRDAGYVLHATERRR